ncbi:hypothetical protein QJS04_geneDACA008673 [Acorus gramineus]|uniref:K Homology domain-containing protein n=1 Tax=Acorus gramineus TaxID=55184 RepID=A0AAV9ABX9_ACOGR|nr:hypothetical protein QJS04_geneDACA008673 [Acorus gramineus]
MATTDPSETVPSASPQQEPPPPASVEAETAAPAAEEETEAGPATPTEPESAVADSEAPADTEKKEEETAVAAPVTEKKWLGWPGDNVFRLIVPVLKVGGIIGRKGELIKKLCEETRARVRILESGIRTSDRVVKKGIESWQRINENYGWLTVRSAGSGVTEVTALHILNPSRFMVLPELDMSEVLISGKEELEAERSPAMEAVLRVFKRVNGINESVDEAALSGAACSIRLLVASTQAMSLIGKQGSLIKSIQESSGASVRVLPADETPVYATADERIVEIKGEALQVFKALEASIGNLRKFLVDHSVIPLYEKSVNAPAAQDHALDAWGDKTQPLTYPSSHTGLMNDYSLSLKRDSLYLDREAQLDLQHSGLSLYGQDPGVSGLRSSRLGRSAGALVTQVTQTMQIPLSYAEDIIGVGGATIAYIRRQSGAILTIQESRGLPDEITVEIKGTSSQVQTAQQLIQDFMAQHKEPVSSSYGSYDSGPRPYSHLSNTSYPSSSMATQSLGSYGSSGVGGYGNYRF